MHSLILIYNTVLKSQLVALTNIIYFEKVMNRLWNFNLPKLNTHRRWRSMELMVKAFTCILIILIISDFVLNKSYGMFYRTWETSLDPDHLCVFWSWSVLVANLLNSFVRKVNNIDPYSNVWTRCSNSEPDGPAHLCITYMVCSWSTLSTFWTEIIW